MEYSTIVLLDYIEDTLANNGLPESWLECDSNNVTWIKKKYVKHKKKLHASWKMVGPSVHQGVKI